MLFDWSAECAADDPVLVIPWSSDQCGSVGPASHFVDLREDPYAVDDIPEADLYPPLLLALRALNGPRSPVFTAKCDAWPINSPEELEALRLNLDLAPEDTIAGFASYLDLLWRDRAIFSSIHQHEHLVDRLGRRAALLDHPFAALECTIRPAFLELAGPQQGFAITLYVKAVGHDAEAASANWTAALGSSAALLRSRDLTPNT